MDTHATLYVAATRGRESNEIWVATDHPPIVNGHRLQPAADRILADILTRTNPAAASAHAIAETPENRQPAQDSPPDLAWLPTRRR